MPLLVQRRTDTTRPTFELRTVLLPFFLSTDLELVRHVDRRLTENFANKLVSEDIETRMSSLAIQAILELRPFAGLKEALEAIESMSMDQLPEEEIPSLEPQYTRAEEISASLVKLDEAV